jgi:hypothetical protein
MNKTRILPCAIALLLGVTAPVSAQTTFYAQLTPGQEVSPPQFTHSGTGLPRPASFGEAILVLSADMTQLTLTITIYNIDLTGTQTPTDNNDNLMHAHIHAAAPPGSNAGVVFGFFGSPFNDNNPNDVVVTPFSSGVGGTIFSKWDAPEGNSTTLALQLNNIRNGLAYLNFHTVQNPAGEIRGQIVPEPSTFALLGIGLLAGGAAACRRRRSTQSR